MKAEFVKIQRPDPDAKDSVEIIQIWNVGENTMGVKSRLTIKQQ